MMLEPHRIFVPPSLAPSAAYFLSEEKPSKTSHFQCSVPLRQQMQKKKKTQKAPGTPCIFSGRSFLKLAC